MILMMREIEDDLSYDKLSTVVLDVEAILNSQPLTCLNLDDIVEPLTPSHLISGKRVLSFPIDRSIDRRSRKSSPSFQQKRQISFHKYSELLIKMKKGLSSSVKIKTQSNC